MRRDWLQITSNVAIVVGLIVVIFELNQNSHHVRAQLVMDDYNIDIARYNDLMGDNPATAIAKAWQDPSLLTPEDEIVVDAYLRSKYLSLGVTQYFAVDLDIFVLWEPVARADAQELFVHPYARQWWQMGRQANWGGHRPLDRLIDEVVEEFERAESSSE